MTLRPTSDDLRLLQVTSICLQGLALQRISVKASPLLCYRKSIPAGFGARPTASGKTSGNFCYIPRTPLSPSPPTDTEKNTGKYRAGQAYSLGMSDRREQNSAQGHGIPRTRHHTDACLVIARADDSGREATIWTTNELPQCSGEFSADRAA